MRVFDLEKFKEKIALSDLDELEEIRDILNKEIDLEYKTIGIKNE